MRGSERGQSTVEWVGLLLLVALLLTGLVAVGVRVPGAALARGIASRILCAASLADSCDGDEPVLIATYGTEVGKLVREHMPSLLFESGSRAVPVDFRRCRSTACGDGAERGYVRRTDTGLPVSAFVHVVDCRPNADAAQAEDANCAGNRAGNLYIQYWTYYADSATLRAVPVAGEEGFHADDWEGVQIRIRPDGSVDERASSHDGYNYDEGTANWGSDIGAGALRGLAEAASIRPVDGWGPETHLLFVSGGSHAGNAFDVRDIERLTSGNRVHLIPLEPIAMTSDASFAISPPWHKKVWRDPEAAGTD
ncbi:MAG TPA: hypothetical protein VN758_12450 [Solirubrobacterales bacterium]|nr:hypothetical protein [Solirubrobacterales bacterium]